MKRRKKAVLSAALAVLTVLSSFPAMAAGTQEASPEIFVVTGGTARLDPGYSEEVTYAYESGDPAVATVDASGKITAVAEGSCDITATAYYGETVVGTKKTAVVVTAENSGGEQGGGEQGGGEQGGGEQGGGEQGGGEQGGGQTGSGTLPEGITRFVYDGSKITVVEGKDTEYGIVNKAGDEVEDAGTDKDGNTYYEASDGDIVGVEIGKKGGSYAFEGTSADSTISVKKGATGDAYLYLNGLDMTSSYTAPIVVKKDSTAAVSIIAVEGTVNTLTDNAYNNDDVYTENADAENAVIKAKDGSDVTIGGSGTLLINGNGKNGIKAANKLAIENVNLSVKAENNGIASDTELTIKSGTLSVEAGNDGIKSSNDEAPVGSITIEGGDITVDSTGDCINATMTLDIRGGTFDLTAYDGADSVYNGDDDSYPSAKGLKASGSYLDASGAEVDAEGNQLNISGGTFTINTADDAIHSDGDFTITGGDFTIRSGDDAIHSEYEGTLGEEGASNDKLNVLVSDCYEGIESATLNIYSGTYEIYCSDDIINAANADLRGTNFVINIYGGDFYCSTSAGDGYDSNGNINLQGGTHVIISDIGLGEGNEPLDSETGVVINGATVLAIGQRGMSSGTSFYGDNLGLTFGSSGGFGGWGGGWGGGPGQQGGSSSLAISSGSTVAIQDAAGTTLIEETAVWPDDRNSGRSASYVMFTTTGLDSGETYSLLVDGESKASASPSQSSGNNPGGPGGRMAAVTVAMQAAAEEAPVLRLNVQNAEKPEVKFFFTYTSDDPQIAAVSEDGLVAGIAKGTTIVHIQMKANETEVASGEYRIAVKAKLPFHDVEISGWYYDYIQDVYEEKWMSGLNPETFGPSDSLARAQLALILYRMSASPAVTFTERFPDVAQGVWYTDAILWAVDQGVVTGYTDVNLFRPEKNISRQEIAVMLWRYAEKTGRDTSISAEFDKFQDAGLVSGYAKEAMSWAVGVGIISGKNETTLDPLGNANRAECAAMIDRFVKYCVPVE